MDDSTSFAAKYAAAAFVNCHASTATTAYEPAPMSRSVGLMPLRSMGA